MKFRIEYIFDQKRPVSLFARQLEAGQFAVSEGLNLGGVPIKPYLSQPRALTPDGRPDMTIFTFVLATAHDLPRLLVGQEVELKEVRRLAATSGNSCPFAELIERDRTLVDLADMPLGWSALPRDINSPWMRRFNNVEPAAYDQEKDVENSTASSIGDWKPCNFLFVPLPQCLPRGSWQHPSGLPYLSPARSQSAQFE